MSKCKICHRLMEWDYEKESWSCYKHGPGGLIKSRSVLRREALQAGEDMPDLTGYKPNKEKDNCCDRNIVIELIKWYEREIVEHNSEYQHITNLKDEELLRLKKELGIE